MKLKRIKIIGSRTENRCLHLLRKYHNAAAITQFYGELLARLGGRGGTRAAGIVNNLPVSGACGTAAASRPAASRCPCRRDRAHVVARLAKRGRPERTRLADAVNSSHSMRLTLWR